MYSVVKLNCQIFMLPIIRQHFRPGTMVYSHEWRAYNQVGSIPVNHSLFFVDPVTGVHTQMTEVNFMPPLDK